MDTSHSKFLCKPDVAKWAFDIPDVNALPKCENTKESYDSLCKCIIAGDGSDTNFNIGLPGDDCKPSYFKIPVGSLVPVLLKKRIEAAEAGMGHVSGNSSSSSKSKVPSRKKKQATPKKVPQKKRSTSKKKKTKNAAAETTPKKSRSSRTRSSSRKKR